MSNEFYYGLSGLLFAIAIPVGIGMKLHEHQLNTPIAVAHHAVAVPQHPIQHAAKLAIPTLSHPQPVFHQAMALPVHRPLVHTAPVTTHAASAHPAPPILLHSYIAPKR